MRQGHLRGLYMKVERLVFFSLVAVVAGYYGVLILSLETISPEIAGAVLSAKKIQGWSDIIKSFYDPNMRLHGWYRPFTFYFTNSIVFNSINPKNTDLIKTIGLFLITVNAVLSSVLAAKIFNKSVYQTVLVFTFVLVNPLYFNIAYEGSGIVDPIFNIFTQIFILILLSMLTVPERHLSKYMFFALVALLIILTSQERGLAVYAILVSFCIYIYFLLPQHQLSKLRQIKIMQLVVASFLFLVPYYYIAIRGRMDLSGPHYRVRPTADYFIDNLYRIFLPLRLHLFPFNLHFDAHYTFFYNLVGFSLLFVCIYYVYSVVTENKTKDIIALKFLCLLFISSLPIPILFGGNSWHFFPASIFYSILLGHAFERIIFQKFHSYKHLVSSVVVFCMLFFTKLEVSAELVENSVFAEYMRIVPVANELDLFKNISPRPKLIFYDITEGHENGVWPYGAGDLFKYVFDDPAILEVPFTQKGLLIPTDRSYCKDLTSPTTYVFKYLRKQRSWAVSSDRFFCN